MDKKKMIYKAKKPNTPREATDKASLRFFFFSFSKFTGVSTIQVLTIIYQCEFLSREKEGEAGYGIFAHSRPDKIGTARLLPLYIRISPLDYQQKKPLKYHILPPERKRRL
jgi:hypothetical protein